jgi:small-conductance mechanosensitive channel
MGAMRRCDDYLVIQGKESNDVKPWSQDIERTRVVCACLWVVLGLAGMGIAQPVPQSQPTVAVAVPEDVERLSSPDAVPTDASRLDALKEHLATRITKLTDAIPTATQPATTQPVTPQELRTATAASLLDALRTYHGNLVLLGNVQAQVNDKDAAERLASDLKNIQDQIDETKRELELARRRVNVDDELLKQTQENWEDARRNLATRRAAHTQRSERLKTADARKEALAKMVADTKAAHLATASEFSVRLSAAREEAEREAVRFDFEAAHVRASDAVLQQAIFELEGQRDQRLNRQADQRLPKLQELVTEREKLATRYRSLAALGEADRVRERIKWAASASEFEKACLALLLEIIEARLEVVRLDDEAGLRNRFREDQLTDLRGGIGRELSNIEYFVESLHRRPSEQVQAQYLHIEQRIAYWERELFVYRGQLDRSYDDRAAIGTRIDELDDTIRIRHEALNRIPKRDVRDDKVTALLTEVGEKRTKLQDKFDETNTVLDDLTQGLEKATMDVAAHIVALSRLRIQLYWSYLSIPNAPIWNYRFTESRKEWNSAKETAKRLEDTKAIAARVREVSLGQYAALAALLFLSAVGAVLWRARLLRAADVREDRVTEQMQEAGLVTAPISDRLYFQGARFVARAGLVVLPSLVALLWVSMTAVPTKLATNVLGWLVFAAIGDVLITTAFSRTKLRFRLVPCSRVVAAHFRLWLRTLLWFSAIAIPVPLMLTTLTWAPYTTAHLWAAYKTVALGIVLAFGRRRQTVLRVVGRTDNLRHPTLFMIFSTAYPFLYLCVVALLVAELIGYNALSTYIIEGILLSISTLLAAGAVNNYLRDLAEKLHQRAAAAAADDDDVDARTEGPSDDRAAALASGQEVALIDQDDASDAALSIDFLLIMIRLTVWAGTAVLTLGAWGIRWVDVRSWTDVVVFEASTDGRPAITLGRALVALGLVLAGWAVSRTVRSVLESRIYTTLTNLDRGARAALSTVLHYMIILVGLYFALYTLRIPLGALTVVLGTLGLGLGLGLQPLFVNFFSGLILLFERHLKLGDIIEIDGKLAEVTSISVRATAIKTFDNIDMLIPNSEFVNSKVVNWTHRDARIRGKVEVGVAYGTDPRLVERVLLQVAHEDPTVLGDPTPRVRFLDFGNSSLDFTLYAWFNSVPEWWDFITDSRYRIIELFNEHGIEIPFPQRTLSTIGGDPLRIRVETSSGRDDQDAAADAVEDLHPSSSDL